MGVYGGAEGGGIIALIAENVPCRDIGDESLGLGEVARLSWRQDEAQRIAQGIDGSMDFCG